MVIRIITSLVVLLIFQGYLFAQLQRPSLTVIQRTGSFYLRARLTREQKKRLQPDPSDLEKYERFLAAPRTGIFRLMPDIGCTENVNVIKVDAVCLNFIPESSYYSFREKEHTLEVLSDLRLRGGF